MKQEDIYRALGMEPKNVEEEPKQQEVVEPAQEPGTENENPEEVVTPPAIAEEGELPAQGEKAPMSKEERAKQAKLRRQREMDDAVARARQEERDKHKAEMDALVKRMNLRDTTDGDKAIETVEELNRWMEKRNDEKLQRDLKAGRLTKETLEAMIEQSPSVKAARQAQAQTERKQFSNVVEQELAQIRKIDPSIESLEDICNGENGEKFCELVNRYNMSFIEAFKLANFDRLQSVKQTAATQAAINMQASKNHLSSVASPASNAVNVPDGVYRNYKMLCPWMSEDDIRKDYAKRTKKG